MMVTSFGIGLARVYFQISSGVGSSPDRVKKALIVWSSKNSIILNVYRDHSIILR